MYIIIVYYLFVFITFFIINLLVSGGGQLNEPFYPLLSILMPFEDSEVIFFRLILNYTIIVIFVFDNANHLTKFLTILSYVLPRCKRRNVFLFLIGRTVKRLAILLIIKLIADLLTGQMNGTENVDVIYQIYLSASLTLIIWALIVLTLFLMNVGSRSTLFVTLFILFTCQYVTLFTGYFDILIITSPRIITEFHLWMVLKMCSLCILMCISYKIFQNKDFIGGVKDD